MLKATGLALALATVILLFVVSQPRLRTFIPGYQAHALQTFISTLERERSLTPQAYWQFREWYSPGSFAFNDDIIELGETLSIRTLTGPSTEILTFVSPKLISFDYLVKYNPDQDLGLQMKQAVSEYASMKGAPPNYYYANMKEVYQDDYTVLTQLNNGKWMLVFAHTLDEMKTANGFFDYTPKDMRTIENTFWLNLTEITP